MTLENPIELWKDVPYNTNYMISSFGRVISKKRNVKFNRYQYQTGDTVTIEYPIKGGFLNSMLDAHGYRLVRIRNNCGVRDVMQVHRLVAQAFIPNPENKPFVNHIDGNKQNNMVTNLEWCTSQENIQHAWDTGLRIVTDETRDKLSKINSIPVICLDTHKRYDNEYGAAFDTNVCRETVSYSVSKNGKNLHAIDSSYTFVSCDYYDSHIDEFETYLDHPEWSRRHVRDIRTGIVYTSANNFCINNSIDASICRYAISEFGGYIPKYDILLRDARYDDVNVPYTCPDDADKHIESVKSVADRIYKYVILEVNSNMYFQTRTLAESHFNLCGGAVSLALNKNNGEIRKKNLLFKKLRISDLETDIFKNLMDHYINAFSKRTN